MDVLGPGCNCLGAPFPDCPLVAGFAEENIAHTPENIRTRVALVKLKHRSFVALRLRSGHPQDDRLPSFVPEPPEQRLREMGNNPVIKVLLRGSCRPWRDS